MSGRMVRRGVAYYEERQFYMIPAPATFRDQFYSSRAYSVLIMLGFHDELTSVLFEMFYSDLALKRFQSIFNGLKEIPKTRHMIMMKRTLNEIKMMRIVPLQVKWKTYYYHPDNQYAKKTINRAKKTKYEHASTGDCCEN